MKNTAFFGSAPDLGAYEVGSMLPHYGVRITDFDGDGDTDGADCVVLSGSTAGLDVLTQAFASRFGDMVP
ncbi:MAG: hypothetical protein KQH63_10000 [Desulfobulbaceae bacterium]|nr:hypothetical protein [Desulfobulbaceae bacterium]